MFINQIDYITKVLVERKIITIDDKEIINYGLSTGFELILNLLTTLVISLILDMVLESIVFLLSFSSIRVYAGGYHLEKTINCYLVSNSIVALVLLSVKIAPREYLGSIILILLVTSLPIILKLAPIGTPNKPLTNYEKNFFRKKVLSHMGIELIIIFILHLFNMDTIALLMSSGIFISSFLVFIATFKQLLILKN